MKNEFTSGMAAAWVCSFAALVACGGGGGSASATAPPVVVTSAPITQTQTVTGKVVGCDATYIGVPPAAPSPEPTMAPCMPGTGLAGVTVTIGSAPPAGIGGNTGGTPSGPLPSVTTAADGTFSVVNVPAGTQYVQAVAPQGAACAEGPYPNSIDATPSPAQIGFADSGNRAVYHGTVTVGGPTVIPAIRLTALTQDELCFAQQAFVDRAALLGSAAPATSPTIDEFAQESALLFGIASEAGVLAIPPTCAAGPPCLPTQLAPQYTANGGLFAYNIGATFASGSWQMSEAEVTYRVSYTRVRRVPSRPFAIFKRAQTWFTWE